MPPTHTRESRLHTLKLNWSETEKKMSGKFCIAVGIILAAFCFVFIIFKGDTGVYAFNTGSYGVDELTEEVFSRSQAVTVKVFAAIKPWESLTLTFIL